MHSKSIDENTAIEFVRVTKTYRLYQSERRRFWGYVSRHRNFRPMRANKNVSFKVKKGEAIAILGNNGAGKSTLLKLITGVTFPSNGVVKVNGRVSALLELSAGFDDFFTGRQNIYLKGMLLGLKKKEIKKLEKKIVEFADLGLYIDQPIRTYSSGMRARLGFAISAHIEPDILVVDEALAVGDKNFRQKCNEKVAEIRNREHVTFMLVTHSPQSAIQMCERGIVMDKGEIKFDGPIREAVQYYEREL